MSELGRSLVRPSTRSTLGLTRCPSTSLPSSMLMTCGYRDAAVAGLVAVVPVRGTGLGQGRGRRRRAGNQGNKSAELVHGRLLLVSLKQHSLRFDLKSPDFVFSSGRGCGRAGRAD